MKNPWVAFAGICSLVIGIVLFSVIFGGYSSFLRAQNRIETAKGLVVEQCRRQLGQVKAMANQPGVAGPDINALLDVSQRAGAVVDRLEKQTIPLEQALISEFGTVQSQLNKTVDEFLSRVSTQDGEDAAALKNKMKAAQEAVFLAGRRYNKEARYFNSRTQVFPGFIVARLFGLDELHFDEMATDLMKPLAPGEVSGAS